MRVARACSSAAMRRASSTSAVVRRASSRAWRYRRSRAGRGEHGNTGSRRAGRRNLPSVAAVVHAVQRQHHRPGCALRQPGAVEQAHPVGHHEGRASPRAGSNGGPGGARCVAHPARASISSRAGHENVTSRGVRQGHARCAPVKPSRVDVTLLRVQPVPNASAWTSRRLGKLAPWRGGNANAAASRYRCHHTQIPARQVCNRRRRGDDLRARVRQDHPRAGHPGRCATRPPTPG